MAKHTLTIMSHDNHTLLKECLERIQKYTPFEYDLIIIDDASSPAYDIPQAKIVRMPDRSDCCNLRNSAMAVAKTDLVFWLDNDTMVGEGWYTHLLEGMKDGVGLTGQVKDSRLIRKPFLPLNQSDCMIEYQFAYDYNHKNGDCDFITSYCICVRRDAFRPTHCYGMPTPVLDPDLGAVIKYGGYKVKVVPDSNIHHIGSGTPRPNGRDYLYHLAENFTKWYQFWEPHAVKIWELYSGREVEYNHDANEPNREQSRNQHGDYDKDLYFTPTDGKYTNDNLATDGLAHRL